MEGKKKKKKKKSCVFRRSLQLIFCPPCRSLPHPAYSGAGQTLTPAPVRENKATPCPRCRWTPGFHPTELGSTCCCCAASLPGKCRAPAQGSVLFLFPKRLASTPVSPDLLSSWAQLPASLPKSPSHLTYSVFNNFHAGKPAGSGFSACVNQGPRTPASGCLAPGFQVKSPETQTDPLLYLENASCTQTLVVGMQVTAVGVR